MTMPLDLDDNESADSIRMALGQFFMRVKSLSDMLLELLQEISSNLNKSMRELFLDGTGTAHGMLRV
jgi:hypothetical protein